MKPDELAQVSLEDLMRIEITAAGRKEQRADSVAAAAFVLTADDIRRSGMRTLPDVLRLVPGVQVAQVNSSRWAVSVRGFNSLYANKLLVLIDGRSLYNRAFSGVFWAGQDVLLEDIARIEVIRGPGGAVWGANAVNGVINIVNQDRRRDAGRARDRWDGYDGSRQRRRAVRGGARARQLPAVFAVDQPRRVAARSLDRSE
jgi:iron complex outermembrane receptor protein